MFKKGDIVLVDGDNEKYWVEVIDQKKTFEFSGTVIRIDKIQEEDEDDLKVGTVCNTFVTSYFQLTQDPRVDHFDKLLTKLAKLEKLCLKKVI